MEKEPIVLGEALARATAAEQARKSAGTAGPSPLGGRSYDVELGEFSLMRFVPSALDAEIEALAAAWRASTPDQLEQVRNSLSLDDNYTLIQFAKRSVLRALNGSSPQPLEMGLLALAMIDEMRVDPRDVSWAVGLWNHAGKRWPDLGPQMRDRAASMATVAMGALLRRTDTSLADWGYREVTVDRGIGLIRSGSARYQPKLDLVALADKIIARVLAARYVCEIEVATDLPAVWFERSRRVEVEQVLERALGVVAVRGDLRETVSKSPSQMFVTWLAELPSKAYCEQLSSGVGSGTGHIGRFVVPSSAGCLFALLVAGSAQIGVPPYESEESLREIAGRTEVLLKRAN